jgi:beta-lactamase regulating signal transducer with metallopeptidase domain
VISALDALGRALALRFAALNVWTAVLLVGAVALDHLLARRTRASLRILLYAPVALRVLAPLGWHLAPASAPRIDALALPVASLGAAAPDAASAPASAPWYALAALAYLAGVLLLAARAIAGRVRLRHAMRGIVEIDRLRASAACRVVEHEELGPMTVGLVNPRIVLPKRLLEPGEERALGCVLRHESAHVRRRDAWLSAAMQLVSIACWPVAPLWIAAGRVARLMELACDESALDGADGDERRRYGHALLDMAEWQSFGVVPLPAGELHFGSTLRARVEALASARRWPLPAQALVAALAPLAMLAACGQSMVLPAASPLDAGYGYEFDVDSRETAAVHQPGPPAAGDGSGRVPPETIQEAVRAHYQGFTACYESGRAKDPHLKGVVSVRFTVGEDGVTRQAANDGSTLPDPEVVDCVAREFRKVTYPKAHAGLMTVVYPIAFAP